MPSIWLSVVMPVYNGAITLRRTLESVLGQQDGVEIIAVDQGSRDASREILHSFQDRLDIRILDAPDNVNWMQNTNLGLRHALGPVCTMLHQDDIWMPGRAATLRRLVESYPQAALWVHDASFIDLQDRAVGRFGPPFGRLQRLVPRDEALSALLVQNTFALPAVVFPRDAVVASGGLDESLWYTADWDLWLRLVRDGPLAWHPARLAGFRLHGGSLTLTGSRDISGFRQQMSLVLDRHISAMPPDIAGNVVAVARAAIELNVCLAAAYHRQPAQQWGHTLRQILRLGPSGLRSLMRDTQIFQRVVARGRARLRL